MKKRLFLWPLCAAMALAGCSNETLNDGDDFSEAGFSDNYLNVSILMPTSNGTRADDDNFLVGTENESKVDNAVFFFFDDNDICVDIQKINSPEFKYPSASNEPQIENIGTVEVRLRTGLNYKKIAVALNSTATDANTLKVDIKNVNDLMDYDKDYANKIKSDGSWQMMSNSVYYDMNDATMEPTDDKKYCLVPITDKNIYTSADNIDDLIDKKEKEYVDIYVERAAARVDVSKAEFNMQNYYISEENNEKKKTISIYEDQDLIEKEITVKPIVKGMCLNVLTPTTNLIKPINKKQVGYGIGENNYKHFQWNDPNNKRSYWASTNFNTGNLKYFSYAKAEEQGPDAFKQYINPNTQDFAPTATNEVNSANTKIMVVAELHKYDDEGNDNGTIDLVKYGGDYMLPEALYTQTANIINGAIRIIDWKDAKLTKEDETPLTEEEIKKIEIAVSHAFEKGLTSKSFQLEDNTNPKADDWEAVITKANNFSYEIPKEIGEGENTITIGEDLIAIAKEKIDKTINNALEDVNKQTILYWKDGKTYFFTGIRHQGFPGLMGTGNDDFLYGVVRNHIYDINLEGLYGLGTPVIDPSKPINPDRPKEERPSFIKAKINILKWRVVKQNATLH